MSALDSVLADLVEADRECAYVTVKRDSLETLIDQWMNRGDQIALLCGLVSRTQKELSAAWPAIPSILQHGRSMERLLQELQSATAPLTTTIVHHRHAVRQELAARLKQSLRSAINEIHAHVTQALLKGESELAERLESERQTVQIIISATDAMVNRLMAQELAKAELTEGKNAVP
jgi:type VI protein secretion system component VasF